MQPRSVTLEDVAAAAGVSYQTVSRVLNHSSKVAEKTRNRVQAAMVALNYVPNRVAQQLAGKTQCTLGLATSDLALLAPAQIASAIHQQATRLGYRLVIAMVGSAGVEGAVQELMAQRVDGLLINLPLTARSASEIARQAGQLPCLFLDTAEEAAVAACQFSASAGARMAVEYLLTLGHRRIALLNGPADSVAARARHQTWRLVLHQHQLAPWHEMYGDWSAASGYQAMLSLADRPLPTAILVANDQMALGALRALQQAGIRIPEDISVTGYDDTAESAWYQPPLTTVRQDLALLGERSVSLLVKALSQQAAVAAMQPFMPSLVVRETTAPPGERISHSASLRELAKRFASTK